MNQPVSISVALCTHNGETYVGEQVASILNQTLKPTEIVLSDDASTDDTVAIVRAAVEGSGVALTVFENRPALGVTANFQQAVLACSGELIALSDQDDVWHPEKLARITEAFANPKVLLVHTDAQLVDGAGVPLDHTLLQSLEARGEEKHEIAMGRGFETLLRRNLVTGATAVFRRSLLEAAVPFDGQWVHDEWLAIIAGAVGMTDLVDEPLIDYRQHGANQIGARKLTFREKLSKFREPRLERNTHLLARAESLVARLEALGDTVNPSYRELAREKLAFERTRFALPSNHLLRLGPVLRNALAGRYRRFTLGLPDVVRDLAQPAR